MNPLAPLLHEKGQAKRHSFKYIKATAGVEGALPLIWGMCPFLFAKQRQGLSWGERDKIIKLNHEMENWENLIAFVSPMSP